MFSTRDLQNGYWQLPIAEEDRPKTAFCPGPGLGSFQFKRMPFSLTGAPSSFQRLMDKVCQGLPFVTTYLDDVLIHSATAEEHEKHLQFVFHCLSQAGLTLRGRKCRIGMSQVTYLGHVFSSQGMEPNPYLGHVFSFQGMEPDPQKLAAVRNRTTPKEIGALRSFLGLASYYRRYIHQFAATAAPLHHLTSKGVAFQWDAACQESFEKLKCDVTKAPVLAFPDFSPTAAPFHLQTDASAVGIGTVLEQDGHVNAYASRVLSSPERNYSVIQRECLAVVYALKQFHHYLLGRSFILLTDHAPLQWLSAQKMEGMLAHWALVMQEFAFTTQYRKGKENGNADSLSRQTQPINHSAASTAFLHDTKGIQQHQGKDPIISIILDTLQQSFSLPRSQAWHTPPLSTLLHQTLETFGIHKSRTTSYHPQGDGMVERFNRTLLQMLRTYTAQANDWEKHLLLVLFAYRSAIHPSTGFSSFELMFGRSGTFVNIPKTSAFEPTSFQAELHRRLAEFSDLVEPTMPRLLTTKDSV